MKKLIYIFACIVLTGLFTIGIVQRSVKSQSADNEPLNSVSTKSQEAESVYTLTAPGLDTATASRLKPGKNIRQAAPPSQNSLANTQLVDAEPNGTSATASQITGTQARIKGNLYPEGDVDFYKFNATAGDRVYAAVMTSLSAGNSTDSQLTLLASDGTTVIEFDDDNGSFAALSSSIAGANIPTTGTYFLKVNDFTAGTASEKGYQLWFNLQSGTPTPEVESNDTPATANPLPANGWVSGTRNPAAATEQDWYSMTLNAGDTVYLGLDLDPERDGVTWNGRLGFALFGDASNQILVVDDAGTGDVSPNPNIPSESMFFTVKTAGTYFAFVDSASAAVGGPTATYNLSVTILPKTDIGVNCTTYTSTDVPKTIGPGTGLTSSTITVPGHPRIADLDVQIQLNHAVMQDVDAHLLSPAGNNNGLFTDIGAIATGGQTMMDTTFDDDAGIPPSFTALRNTTLAPENNSTVGSANTSGAYRLDWFNGEDAGGTWTLNLYDDTAGANGGTLTSWGLRVCEMPPALSGTTVFSTDFESGAAGFTHSGTADEWELGLPATAATTTANPVAAFTTCNSGTSCWKTDLDNTYEGTSSQDLVSPNINLNGFTGQAQLQWAMKYQMETANFDHARVIVREVGNPSNSRTVWEWLGPSMISASAGTGNPQNNIGASAGWGIYRADISSFANKNIEVVFHLDSRPDNSAPPVPISYGGLAIDDVSVTAAGADLSITKTDGVTTAVPGGTVTYTITASNTSATSVTGATVADTFPAILTPTWTCVGAGGGTCTAAGSGNINDTVNLPAGGSVTYTASATINASATGTLSNTATVATPAGVPELNPADNSATDTDTLTPQANLGITKTDGVTTATPGGSVTYTITASNAGPSNANGATVADTFPASLTATWTCVGAGGGTCTASGSGNINDTVNLPSGGSVTYTASATISAAATGTLSNTATVAAPAGVTDPTPGNNSATDSDTLAPSADLAITKTDGVTSVTAGGTVTYTITASNTGPSNATGATVTDTFPASLTGVTWTCVGAGGGTCTAAGAGNINNTVNLPSGGSVTYTVNATVSPAASGTLSNTATVMAPAGVTDPNPANNSATDTDTIIVPNADLAVTKTDSPDPVAAGNNIVYTIIVSNNGPGNATTATLTDALPANTTFQSITAPAGWTCTTPAVNAGGTVSCTNASLANGASGTFILVVNVNTGTANGTISNTATVSTSVTDPVAGNNSSTATTTVAEFVSPAPNGQASKALLVKPAAGNTTAGGGVSDSSCVAPTGVTVAGVFANINQALGAASSNGDTIYVCPKYTGGLVVPYVEQVSLGFTNLSVVGIGDAKGSRAVIAANPSTATTPTTQLGTNYIVQIVATGVNFGNFVVDGAPGGTNFANTGIFNGIVVRRSGAFVFNNTVQNIRTTDSTTNANGQGIAVFGAGSAGSPLEGGTTANPVNILNNVVQTYRSNGVNVSAGSSSSYAFVRGNYIIGNGATPGSVNQSGVQFQASANGDIFNNRITNIQGNNLTGCSPALFGNCSSGIRLNTTSSSSTNNLRVRFNLISNTQTGILAQDVQYVSMTSNTISFSFDGINLRGSAFNLGSNFSTINQNTILSSRRAGVFIGLIGGDASLGNNLTQNTIEDVYTGVANNTPAGNNTIPTTGATANTFISVNNFVSSVSSGGVNDVQNTNPLP